jgi:hypothetical protein
VEIVFGIVLFACVAAFVLYPLFRSGDAPTGEDPELADLEARREAKYREIRDAQLDLAAGKLSQEDFDRQDAELRREAVEILHRLDAVKGREAPPEGSRRPAAGEAPRTPADG